MEEKRMEQKGFDFSTFINEWTETLVNPKSYFSTMKTEGGLAEPVVKALIYGVVAGIIYFIWSLLHMGAGRYGYLGGLVGISALFTSTIGAVIGVFVGGVIVLILSSISEGNKEFEACLRVSAALMAIFPVSALLSLSYALNAELGSIASLCINLYGLYLLYNGIIYALKGNEKTAKIIALVLGGLMLLIIIIGMIMSLAIRSYSGFSQHKAEEIIKDYEGLAQKAAADYKKVAEDLAQAQNEVGADGKPDTYPMEAIKQVRKSFATGPSKITRETMQQLVTATRAINDLEPSEKSEALKQNGFPTQESYQSAFVSVMSGISALGGLNAMQQIIDATSEEQKAAEAFTLDEATLSIATQSIATGKLTEKDLQTIYDNWDLALELKSISNN